MPDTNQEKNAVDNKDKKRSCKKHVIVEMVDKWLRREEVDRNAAVHASFVLLMSDFLFSRIRLPPKWLGWVYHMKMIALTNEPEKARSDDLQSRELAEHQLIVVKMLFKAHSVARCMTKHRYSLIGLLEIMNLIESYNDLSKAIIHARSQEQIKLISDPLLDICSKYDSNDKSVEAIDMNFYDFAESHERRVLASLLVGRALQSLVFSHGSSEEFDIVKELDSLCVETKDALHVKMEGNDLFKRRLFEKALEKYSKAICYNNYNGFLYGNRCQTALNLKQFDLAVSDGFRAVTLKPQWGKAYYRLVKALDGKGNGKEAVYYCKLGLTWCRDSTQDLLTLKTTLCKQYGIPDTSDDTTLDLSNELKNSKKNSSQNSNVKKTKVHAPALLSDDDSLSRFSDVELQKKFHGKRKKIKKSAPGRKHGSVNEIPKTLSKVVPKSTSTKKTNKDDKDNEIKAKGNLKQARAATALVPSSTTETKKETPPSELFLRHGTAGSEAVMRNDFTCAAKEFQNAINSMEKIPLFWNVDPIIRFALFYARGYTSLEISTPIEVGRSLDIFAAILSACPYDEIFHPVPYYGVARAHLLLNNFALVSRPVYTGLKFLEKKKYKPFPWPGIDTFIPETEPENLEKALREILLMSRCPPKPDAVCFFEQCERNVKNEGRFYSLCEKDVFRKDIYSTDLNFEGFMKMMCSWECVTCFHFKCWPKFKRNSFERSGDKEILDLPCFTEGCKGSISRIIMVDENNQIKKDISSEKGKQKEKEQHKKVPPPQRMSKNERNLMRRRKQLEEAKNKKHSAVHEINTMQENPTTDHKPKPDQAQVEKAADLLDTDISKLTVLKRDEPKMQSGQLMKSKIKPKQKKKINTAVTLQEFLGEDNSGVNTADIQEAISSRSPDSPFRVPESLREEIGGFESQFSEEEDHETTWLCEYFDAFFKENGPRTIADDLLQQQQLFLPVALKRIVEDNNGIAPFLCQHSDKFLAVEPYIGLLSQGEEITRLAEDYNKDLKPKCGSDKSPAHLSEFARDLYGVGDVDLSEIRNLTGNDVSAPAVQTGDDRKLTLAKVVDLTTKPVLSGQSNGENTSTRKSLVSHMGGGDHANHVFGNDITLENDSDSDTSSSSQDQQSTRKVETIEPTSSTTDESLSEESSDDDTDDEDSLSEQSVSVCDNEEQTELMPSYLNQITRLQQEKELLEKQFEELSDRYARLNATSRAELNQKRKDLDDLKEELLAVRRNALEVTQHAEAELKKISKDKSMWQENIRTMKHQLKEAKSKEKESEERVKGQDVDLERLNINFQEHQSAWMEEKQSGEKERKIVNQALRAANKRAVEAELKALECEESYGLKTLVIAKKECERYVVEFEKLVRLRLNNSPTVQRDVYSGLHKWKTNIETCSQYIKQTKEKFSIHASLIRQGNKLSDLAPVIIPPPPNPGPYPQHVALQSMPTARVGGNPVSLSAFPRSDVASTSTTLLGSLDTLPSSSTARQPQLPIGSGKQGSSSQSSPAVAPGQNAASQSKGSFEKIMSQLLTKFPTVSRAELAQCIKEVRQSNNNSLTGLSLEEIVQQTSLAVGRKNLGRKPISTPSISSALPSAAARASPAPTSVAPWFHSQASHPRSPNAYAVSDEEPCVICHDPLTSMEMHRLLCGHIFHNDCLMKWLERNRTCPTCRDYAVDTSEYPALSMVKRH